MTHQASNLFLRSTSEFHDSREGHALQRLVDACFGRELRNVMEKKLQLLWGGLAVEYELKKLKVFVLDTLEQPPHQTYSSSEP